MANNQQSVFGIEDACAMLAAAPENLVRRAFPDALDASGDIFKRELEARTPVDDSEKVLGNAAHGGKGPLRANVTAQRELYGRLDGGSVDVGYGDLGHIALWLEYGHRMLGHKPQKKLIEDIRAKPVMRPAFDASADRAIEAFQSSIVGSIRSGRVPGVVGVSFGSEVG